MAKTVEELQAELARYEENGPAKLCYALNRKANEMADLLNKHTLTTLDVADGKDKTWERLKSVWADAKEIAEAIKSLGDLAGITGDEAKDVARKPWGEKIATDRK